MEIGTSRSYHLEAYCEDCDWTNRRSFAHTVQRAADRHAERYGHSTDVRDVDTEEADGSD